MIERIGDTLNITNSGRIGFGNQFDFSEYPNNTIGSIKVGFNPPQRGKIYAEASIDDNIIHTSLLGFVNKEKYVFIFEPPLKGGFVYGVRYFRFDLFEKKIYLVPTEFTPTKKEYHNG